jgi:hypothetical protein
MSKKHHWYLVAICFLFGLMAQAAVIRQSLYINRGVFETVNSTYFPYIAFNDSRSFNAVNAIINIKTTDQLILTVINTDSIVHGFEITQYGSTKATIAPKDSIIDTLQFNREGLFIFYDSYQYPRFRYLGEAGMICVNNSTTDKKYYWNLKEHQTSYNELLNVDQPVSWSNYTPDYFTINSFSYPFTRDDLMGTVHEKVGDTVHIFVANTGQSAHSIHFHGFHCKIIYSSNSAQIGWEKDTFPMRSMDVLVLELVADKIGRYTVHDHNLTAITGGGLHPRGMLTLIAFDQ